MHLIKLLSSALQLLAGGLARHPKLSLYCGQCAFSLLTQLLLFGELFCD
jgi:hypothetical protein